MLCRAVQTVWVDPICGDGTCEAPFEFASFSRFGCKADCGRLSDIQKLTNAQVSGGGGFDGRERGCATLQCANRCFKLLLIQQHSAPEQRLYRTPPCARSPHVQHGRVGWTHLQGAQCTMSFACIDCTSQCVPCVGAANIACVASCCRLMFTGTSHMPPLRCLQQ